MGRAAPPNKHKEIILGDADWQRQGRGKDEEGEQELPPKPLQGTAGPSPSSHLCCVCANGGAEGQSPPGRVPPALEDQDVSSPSSVPPPQHSRAEGPGEGRAGSGDPTPACHPWKAGAAVCGGGRKEGRKCRSISRKPPCPAVTSPKAGEGVAAPRPPLTAPRGSGSALPVLRRLRDAGRAQQSMNGRSGFLPPPRRPPGAGGSSCSALAS